MFSSSTIFSALCMFAAGVQAFNITTVGLMGTGCAPGTVNYNLNAEKTSISAIFSGFTAVAGTTLPMSGNRKSCQITYSILVDSDEQVALDTFSAKTVYGANSGIGLTFQSSYYAQGELSTALGKKELKGPVFSASTVLSAEYSPKIWTKCGVATVINVATDLRVSAAGASGPLEDSWGLLSLLSTNGPSFIARKCTPESS